MVLSFRYSEPNNTIYPSDAPKQHICHSSLSFYFFFGELMRIMSCSKMPQQNKRNNHPSLLVFYMQNSCVSSSTYKQRHQIRGKPAVTAAARKGGDLQRGPERLLGVQHKPWLGAGTSLPSLSSHQLSVLGLLTTRQQLDSHQKPHPPRASGLLKASLPFESLLSPARNSVKRAESSQVSSPLLLPLPFFPKFDCSKTFTDLKSREKKNVHLSGDIKPIFY